MTSTPGATLARHPRAQAARPPDHELRRHERDGERDARARRAAGDGARDARRSRRWSASPARSCSTSARSPSTGSTRCCSPGAAANERGVPVVLDPVGAGATRYRTETARRILDAVDVAVLRGNAGEVATLVGVEAEVRGVESVGAAGDSAELAQEAARTLGRRRVRHRARSTTSPTASGRRRSRTATSCSRRSRARAACRPRSPVASSRPRTTASRRRSRRSSPSASPGRTRPWTRRARAASTSNALRRARRARPGHPSERAKVSDEISVSVTQAPLVRNHALRLSGSETQGHVVRLHALVADEETARPPLPVARP